MGLYGKERKPVCLGQSLATKGKTSCPQAGLSGVERQQYACRHALLSQIAEKLEIFICWAEGPEVGVSNPDTWQPCLQGKSEREQSFLIPQSLSCKSVGPPEDSPPPMEDRNLSGRPPSLRTTPVENPPDLPMEPSWERMELNLLLQLLEKFGVGMANMAHLDVADGN